MTRRVKRERAGQDAITGTVDTVWPSALEQRLESVTRVLVIGGILVVIASWVLLAVVHIQDAM
jgi:hypothetical protein